MDRELTKRIETTLGPQVPGDRAGLQAVDWGRVLEAARGLAGDAEAVSDPDLCARGAAWLAGLVHSGALDPVERAEAGRLLGTLGDPRPGVGLTADGLPDIDWVEIPAGPFLMGSDRERDPGAFDDELPLRTFELDTYWIARYPVTYAQYAAFVDDSEGGYALDRYWTAAGLRWREDRCQPEVYWKDPDWHIANHPVVGVTWYEAVAFCWWLTEKVGDEIRLPNEAEREKAVRGTDGRVYPWGDEYISGYANINETPDYGGKKVGPYYLGRTTAVGIYGVENAAYGLRDMSGNVQEWCATKQDWCYKDGLTGMDNSPDGTRGRVLRGNSWYDFQWSARGAQRIRFDPDIHGFLWGFRVCASAPS